MTLPEEQTGSKPDLRPVDVTGVVVRFHPGTDRPKTKNHKVELYGKKLANNDMMRR